MKKKKVYKTFVTFLGKEDSFTESLRGGNFFPLPKIDERISLKSVVLSLNISWKETECGRKCKDSQKIEERIKNDLLWAVRNEEA